VLKKEETMNYTKPEVAVLGGATRMIEQIHIKGPGVLEFPIGPRLNPAYDVDE
jgi:hypothetical protein